jgi:hypothetical protein
MTSNSFSTADVSSDVALRVTKAIQEKERKIDFERLAKLREFKVRVDRLKDRGLLNQQEYSNFTTVQFEKWSRNN